MDGINSWSNSVLIMKHYQTWRSSSRYDVIDNWKKELQEMNKNKVGEPYAYPHSFIQLLGYMRIYFHLLYRQTEVLLELMLTIVLYIKRSAISQQYQMCSRYAYIIA
jgi:hypothetical protein